MAKLKKRLKPQKMPSKEYRAFWRVVDGAVANAFKAHPEYFTETGSRQNTARMSIVKRVVGAVTGYSAEKRRRFAPGHRSGEQQEA